MYTPGCGGCEGLGNHRRLCPLHPHYHPWKLFAEQAETAGDVIGSNNGELANQPYALGAKIRAVIAEEQARLQDPEKGQHTRGHSQS